MNFFASKGFHQLTSPYYDVGNTSSIRAWRLAQEGIANVDGMMYTTWASDYRFLRAFGYYAWSAGPYIMFRPDDSLGVNQSSISLSCEVFADPYDASDYVKAPTLVIHKTNLSQVPVQSTMTQGIVPGPWFGGIQTPKDLQWLRYSIRATNNQGITRETPIYELRRQGSDTTTSIKDFEDQSSCVALRVSTGVIELFCAHNADEYRIYNILGGVAQSGTLNPSGSKAYSIETRKLSPGPYVLSLSYSSLPRFTQMFLVY